MTSLSKARKDPDVRSKEAKSKEKKRLLRASEAGKPRIDRGGETSHVNLNSHARGRSTVFETCCCCNYQDRSSNMKVRYTPKAAAGIAAIEAILAQNPDYKFDQLKSIKKLH